MEGLIRVDFPLWVVINIEIMADESVHPFSAIAQLEVSHAGEYEQVKCLAVFTSQAAAAECIKNFNLPPCLVKATDREELFGLFREAEKYGTKFVGFDVVTVTGTGLVFTIADVREDFLE